MAGDDQPAKRDVVPGLGARLEAARLKAGLTKAAAARLSGVNDVNLGLYERDMKTPSFAVVIRLAKAYEVTLNDLAPEGFESPGPVVVVEPKPVAKGKRK